MPLRLFFYINEVLREHIKNAQEKDKKNKKKFNVPAVIPIVLYNATREWNALRCFKEIMYNSQVSPGSTYDKLKKCITINIVDFETIPLDKIHTKFHILEDETGYKLTDVLEIHFLELPKLDKLESIKDIDDPIVDRRKLWISSLERKQQVTRGLLK